MKNNEVYLSLIIPCYNEEGNLQKLYDELMQVVLPLQKSYEILFVNDGSKDNTEQCILDLHAKDKNVKLISFARNYGHQVALMTGLRKCKGEIALSLDADLQQHPRYIPAFIEKQLQTQALIIEGKSGKNQQSGFFKNIFSALYYYLFALLTDTKLEPRVSDFRLYTRIAVDALCQIKEEIPFVRGRIAEMGMPKHYIEYTIEKRNAGSPGYTFKKSLLMAYNSFLSYSKLPYKLGLVSSCFFMAVAFFLSVQYLYLRLFTENYIAGETTLLILICLGFSVVLFVCALLLRSVCEALSLVKGQKIVLIVNEL